MTKKKFKITKERLLSFGLPLLFILFLVMLASSFNIGVDEIGQGESKTQIDLPFFGELELASLSLLFAAVIIGLLDGFNPCAMWVLIYLITLVSQISDKRKMYYVVGTFLAASGILYFAILALWLAGWQFLSFLGFSQWILYAVGAFALYSGAYALYDFYRKGGEITCEVGDLKSRKKMMTRIQELVKSPITILSFFALIALAFAVNMLEFVCSVGLPALFTQLLSLADTSLLMKYFYIGVYTLAFMADDLLIFTLALKAINSDLMQRYSGLSKLLGGVIMIGIGIILLFFPGLLA
jgi:MFS family permease